jgi:hypothetical protein
MNFAPSQLPALLASPVAPAITAAGRIRFLLHTVAGLPRRLLQHYYTLVCHPAEHLAFLESPLVRRYPFQEFYRASPVNGRPL